MSENKNNVPKLRFPEFTGAWEQRKLSEMTAYYNGKGHEDKQRNAGKYELINLNSISIDGGLKHSGKYIDEANDTLLKDDLVMVLSDVGHGDLLGRVAVIPENNRFVLNQRVALLRPNNTAYPQFLFAYINAHQGYFKAQGAGMSQLNISKGSVESFIDFVPVYAEQVQIGEFFTSLDRLITLHQRKLGHLQELKTGLLQKMFPKDGETVPEIRFPEFTDAWEERKLSELASFSKGQGYSKGDLREEGTPIILYGRLYTKYETVISEVDTFVHAKENSVYSRGNEVIIPASGETAEDISRAAVVENAGVLLGGDLNVLQPNPIIDPVFLALAISNGEQQKELSKRAQGKSVVHLHNSDLQEVYLAYPKLSEQKKIGLVFRDFDRLITLHQRKLGHLQEQKKALLGQMFV